MDLLLSYRMFLGAITSVSAQFPTRADALHSAMGYRASFLQLADLALHKGGENELKSLQRITLENIAQLERSLSFRGIRVSGKSMAELAAKVVLLTPDSFVARDSSGRAWPATGLVKMVLAGFSKRVEIDKVIAAAEERGATSFMVHNHKPGHRFDGLKLTLAELLARRDEIFHPGSQSTLTIDG